MNSNKSTKDSKEFGAIAKRARDIAYRLFRGNKYTE